MKSNSSIPELIKKIEIENRIKKSKDLKKIIQTLRINNYLSYWLVVIIEFLILFSICAFLPRLLFKTDFSLSNSKQLVVIAFLCTVAFLATSKRLKTYFDKLLLKRVIKKVKYLNEKWK